MTRPAGAAIALTITFLACLASSATNWGNEPNVIGIRWATENIDLDRYLYQSSASENRAKQPLILGATLADYEVKRRENGGHRSGAQPTRGRPNSDGDLHKSREAKGEIPGAGEKEWPPWHVVNEIRAGTQSSWGSTARQKNTGSLYFTREWFGNRLNENLDPNNLVGMNDMSQQEVLKYVTEERPDLVESGVIDPENPESSIESLEGYYRDRVRQRQRISAHGTYFTEMRNYMAAKMENRDALEWSDKKLIVEYAKVDYQGQEVPDIRTVIADMIEEGKQRFRALEENSDNVRRAENAKEFAALTNELEEHHETAKKEGFEPEMAIAYKDPDTGTDLMFASPERANQYQRRTRWRSLDYKSRGAVKEWFTGATARTGIDMATFLTQVGRYVALFLEKSGAAPTGVAVRLRNLQKNLDAIRSSSSIRQGDALRDEKVYKEGDSWYAPTGSAIKNSSWWASKTGEMAGLLGPSPGAVAAVSGIVWKACDELFQNQSVYPVGGSDLSPAWRGALSRPYLYVA